MNEQKDKKKQMMGEGLRLASSIKPSTAGGPAVSGVIGSAVGGGGGRGRGGEGLFWVLMFTPFALLLG